ncbi:MAG: ATPase, histidine kinase, gyrase and HSP90-like domain protein, partial [Clostridiales bacterium]|nr:ATPase, histidine kinase, gyrase and HSP90-like domain protein [Clostridiales bacterium]
MLKPIKNLFLVGPKLTTEENNEFQNSRNELNIKRCKTVSYFLLPLNIALILVDIFLYKPLRVYTPAYTYLFYSHVVITLLIILWLLILEIIMPKTKNPKYTVMCHILVTIVIYWGVFMAINDMKISKHILAYIVCVLALSIFIYLSPVEGFMQYFVSLLVLFIGLFLYAKDNKILYNNIVNGIIAILCSYVALKINYSALKRDFLSKKIILRSKMEIERSHLKLEEYEKLRTDFFANISHELRTPLNIIYGSQQMIENILSGKNKNSGNIDNYLNMIKQNSFRLTKLISNLIDMTKIDSTVYEIRPMNCDIIELVESISMSVAGYIESRNISLIFDTEVEEKVISCDPEKIERIMLNLLSNAIKFTDINGSIFVNIY